MEERIEKLNELDDKLDEHWNNDSSVRISVEELDLLWVLIKEMKDYMLSDRLGDMASTLNDSC